MARSSFLTLILGGLLLASPPSLADDSLKTIPIPEPSDLANYVTDKVAAIKLGKALFWDMQLGSDGVQACASCHFHAGADKRLKNQLSPGLLAMPPDTTFQIGPVNYQLTPADFPFHRLTDPTNADSAVISDANDVASSMGVFLRDFIDIVPGSAIDDCVDVADPVFSEHGVNTRRVEPRNTPSAINAVFNFRNFWDGRASFFFNGVDPVGVRNPDARIIEEQPGGAFVPVSVLIDNASLASQAVGPPGSPFEMSCGGRTFPKIGKKMLSLTPLAKQFVSTTDSVLADCVTPGMRGLNVGYAQMIMNAFDRRYWDSTEVVTLAPGTGMPVMTGEYRAPVGTDEYTVMEYNFSLFFGLAVQLYEATLVSGQSPFDMSEMGDADALTDLQAMGQSVFGGKAKCGNCHVGPEFSGATTSNVGRAEIPLPGEPPAIEFLIERMNMGNGEAAFYDSGFYNIGVRPTLEDKGVGGEAAGPICFSRRASLGLPNPEIDWALDPAEVPAGAPVACDGAFKTSILRNIELTAPYFHNGGNFTLRQVIEFYNRGGDFAAENIDNLDPDIEPLGLDEAEINSLVAFLESLTDPRVRFKQAPFDHPELFVPVGHLEDVDGYVVDDGTGKAVDILQQIPAVGAEGQCIGIDGVPMSVCDDGIPCTVDAVCEEGCHTPSVPDDALCNDGTVCTIDTCDVDAFGCVYTPVNCDDADACTVDVCHDTFGCLHTAVDCDDGNPCTVDYCDVAGGCVNEPMDCDDGLGCTIDLCVAGVCVNNEQCANGQDCNETSGMCDPLVCVAAGADPSLVLAGAMSTGVAYTGGADLDPLADNITSPLLFAASSVADFSGFSGDEGTYAVTLPVDGDWYAHGRFYYPSAPGGNGANSFFMRVGAGSPLKFGNNKDQFQKWHWDGDGTVESGPTIGLHLGMLTAGTYPISVLKREVLPDGSQPRLDMICFSKSVTAPADDGAVSVLGLERCADDGDCGGSSTCNPITGVCEDLSCAIDADCDDGNGCTIDSCEGGVCMYAGVDCDDGDACTTDVCLPLTGSCGNTPIDCDDGNACTADTCDSAAGCEYDTITCPAGEICSPSTGICAGNTVCIDAGSDPSALFSGAMTADGTFTGGADLDPVDDSLTAALVYAASATNAPSGGSGDEVSYSVTLPMDGDWYAWARLYYPGTPGSNEANSFMLRFAGSAAMKFGNNKDFFRDFHWDGDGTIEHGAVAGLYLGNHTAGTYELVVEKREVLPNGFEPRVDVICLTKDGAVAPTDEDALGLIGGATCESALDCDDGNSCTIDSCDAGSCSNTAISCDDLDACTTDTCDPGTGVCMNTAKDCDDGSVCTADTCDAVSGACMNTPIISCDDGDACTTDSCHPVTGSCSNNAIDCDDGNLCTVDTCDMAAGCANDSVVCPDGETCNPGTGMCQAGLVCIGAGDASAAFSGAMTTSLMFTGGADLDPLADNLTSPLVHAASTVGAFSGGSGDEVSYTVEIPMDGMWFLWGRFYYPGTPGSNDANSFLARFDGSGPMKFGNNKDFFQAWHWDGDGTVESGAGVGLALGMVTAGTHTVVIEKREVLPDGTQPRLDVLCLSKDGATPPDDGSAVVLAGP